MTTKAKAHKSAKVTPQMAPSIEVQTSELERLKAMLNSLEKESDEAFELMEQINDLELDEVQTSERQSVLYLSGSNRIFNAIYNNSVKGQATPLCELWQVAKHLQTSTGKPKPMTWNAFTRTWNTSRATLKKNKAYNLKHAQEFGKDKVDDKGRLIKRKLENVSYFETLVANLNDPKLDSIFGKFKDESGKVEFKCFVTSEFLNSENRKGLPSPTPKLLNSFKIANSSLEVAKAYLISKGAKETDFDHETE